jgi:hypothetical protein
MFMWLSLWLQEGVIAVLRHPQYGANPASPSVPFEFKLPPNQI